MDFLSICADKKGGAVAGPAFLLSFRKK